MGSGRKERRESAGLAQVIDLEDAACIIENMRELMDADMWEEDRARAIYLYHRGIGEEAYLAVWDLLKGDSRLRNAWKGYCRQGQLLESGRRNDQRPAVV